MEGLIYDVSHVNDSKAWIGKSSLLYLGALKEGVNKSLAKSSFNAVTMSLIMGSEDIDVG